MSSKTIIFVLIVLISSGCTKSTNENESQSNTNSSLQTDSLQHSLVDAISENYFNDRLSLVNDSLLSWGFVTISEVGLGTREDYNKHWWLKIFNEPSTILSEKEQSPNLIIPELTDFNKIDHIRQFTFKKTWNFTIEEWTFSEPDGADRWLNIAVNAKKIDSFKPPRVFWAKNNKLYFIMATAAVDWTDHSEELIRLMNGNSRWLIELMNEPLNLTKFLDKSGAGEGKEGKVLDYYHMPNSDGAYINYREFKSLDNDSLNNSLVLTTFITNDNEELIAIRGALNHPALDDLSIVGQTRSEIEGWLGSDYHKQGSSILYSQNHSFLVITFQNEKAVWFDFFKANRNINGISDLPGYELPKSE